MFMARWIIYEALLITSKRYTSIGMPERQYITRQFFSSQWKLLKFINNGILVTPHLSLEKGMNSKNRRTICVDFLIGDIRGIDTKVIGKFY